MVVVGGRGRGDKYVGSQPVHSEDRDVKVTVTVTSREIQSTNMKSTRCRPPVRSDAYILQTHHQYEYDHSSTTQNAASGEQGRWPPA